jgi:hypothetical protein
MKKLIFTMLIALFSILSFNEAKAQSCPPGYQTGNIIINICGCDYYINYCFQCNISYPSQIKLNHYYKDDNCDLQCSEETVNSYLRDYFSNPQFLDSLCGLPGPCPNNGREWVEEFPLCYYKIKFQGDNDKYYIDYVPCDQNRCVELFRLCWDPLTISFLKTIELYWTLPTGQPYCTDTEEKYINLPVEINTPTGCFHFTNDPCWVTVP